MNEIEKNRLYTFLFLVVISTLLLSSFFIISTIDDKFTNELNSFTGLVHTRGEIYFMATLIIFMIFLLFWHFLIYVPIIFLGDE